MREFFKRILLSVVFRLDPSYNRFIKMKMNKVRKGPDDKVTTGEEVVVVRKDAATGETNLWQVKNERGTLVREG